MKTLSIIMFAALATSCFNIKTEKTTTKSISESSVSTSLNNKVARIKTIHGDIVFKFYSKVAPITTKRIQQLISDGFYNGLTFHRVIPNFVVQGGDPKGNGTGGSGKNIVAEFNSYNHVPGTVAMARSRNINSADSQFYISLGTHPHLDNQYTVFGQVTTGLDVAKKIKVGDKMISVTLE